MGYSVSYDEKRYLLIARVIEQVKNLTPGGRVVVKGADKQTLGRMRSLLYDWLNQMGLKVRYRVRTDYKFCELEIRDLRMSNNVEILIDSPKVPYLEPLLQELIKSEDEEEQVRKWVEEGKISVQEGALLLERLTEILR